MQNKWWLLFKVPAPHPGGRCTHTHTALPCVHVGVLMCTQTYLLCTCTCTQTLMCMHRLTFILSIQTQRHMSVYVCSCVYTDPPSHYTNTLRGTHLELLTGNRHSETSFSFTFGLTTQAPLSTHTGISENSPARNGKDSAAGPHPLHLPEPTALGRPLRAPL